MTAADPSELLLNHRCQGLAAPSEAALTPMPCDPGPICGRYHSAMTDGRVVFIRSSGDGKQWQTVACLSLADFERFAEDVEMDDPLQQSPAYLAHLVHLLNRVSQMTPDDFKRHRPPPDFFPESGTSEDAHRQWLRFAARHDVGLRLDPLGPVRLPMQGVAA